MLNKIITTVFLLSTTALAIAGERKAKIDELFDNDSDFMRGFETGLFLRTKGGSVAEYGCKDPTARVGDKGSGVFDTIKTAVNAASQHVKMDPIIRETIDVITDFLDGFNALVKVLTPKKDEEMDYYCTGVVFGLQGSKILVKVANTLGEKKELPNQEDIGDWFQTLTKGLFKTAENTMNHFKGGRDGDL